MDEFDDIMKMNIDDLVSNDSNQVEENTYDEDIDLMNMEIDDPNYSQSTEEPKFNVGDVVIDLYSELCPNYIIKETILIKHGGNPLGYKYALVPINYQDDGTFINNVRYIIEDVLSFMYHDTNWEKYFTEGTRQNELPAWRGELYNFFMFFDDYSDISLEPDAGINKHEMEEFKDHTVPPIRMWHILRSHSIFARVYDVIKPMENRKIIANEIDINIDDVKRFAQNFNRKIISRNATNTTYSRKIKDLMIPKFTDKEEIFANLIDRLDTSNKGIKDHYPYRLTNLQIMDAIREAYSNARKVSLKETDVGDSPTDEDPDAPYIGKQEYEGYSERYDLVIRFMYNFDYNFIETAYPLRMNNNIKKH